MRVVVYNHFRTHGIAPTIDGFKATKVSKRKSRRAVDCGGGCDCSDCQHDRLPLQSTRAATATVTAKYTRGAFGKAEKKSVEITFPIPPSHDPNRMLEPAYVARMIRESPEHQALIKAGWTRE